MKQLIDQLFGITKGYKERIVTLEAQNADLKAKYDALKAEQDAAIADIQNFISSL